MRWLVIFRIWGICGISAITATLAACGPSAPHGDDDGSDGDGGECGCTDGQVCVPDLGCRDCFPGNTYCAGPDEGEVWQCNADGTGGELVETCSGNDVCHNGFCLTPCERSDQIPSNVGCHFYAVDLDNEAVTSPIENDAQAQQFAIAIANVNEYEARVDVYKNVGRMGDPIQEQLVTSVMVAPMSLEQIDLPAREVDGSMGQNGSYTPNSGSNTFVSSHAYRVETNAPVVAYQFQPVIQQFSNDASILIPRQALGESYYVLGWPTANPCGAPPGDPGHFESIPDHTAITIVGVEPNTHVQVFPTHPISATGGDSGLSFAATPAGTPLEFDIGPYDVVNLASDQPQVSIIECFNFLDRDGDFTGSQVISNKPVIVFSNLERGIGTGGAEPPDPPGWDGETCCTDHMEQQMFPVTALGWDFAISRSPVRSTSSSYEEPDIYRILATVDGTTVTTSLPPPHAQFNLNAGEWTTFHSYGGFTVHAEGGAVMMGQYLLSQGYIPEGGIGDPTFIVFPAADQHRDEYVFLVPTTFEDNYMVLAMPDTAGVEIDGDSEFGPNCEIRPIGALNGVNYQQMTCEMTEGVHTVRATEPVGLSVYGYYNVGSYGYPGGSDVKIINPID
jgi:hypothetical protein